jgi:uncharacterized SAM-binding protein YcdF (DUF218 family)
MAQEKKLWGLLRRRECLLPTWRGWLVIITTFGLTFGLLVLSIHPFLAVTQPLPGGALIVEGWAADFVMKEAVAEFNRNHYEKVYVTGGPVMWGAPLSRYKTYAERGAAVLVRMGMETNSVQAVPSKLAVLDRTYASAIGLREWLRKNGVPETKVHLFSEGPHARRSRLLFEKALGENIAVGITAVPIPDYDARHWWRSSAGVRAVIDEGVAYVYARFFFRAPKDEPQS